MASVSNMDCYILGGYRDLENISPDNSGEFQALGGQLYTHGSAISDAASNNTLPDLAAVWHLFGGGVLEAGENSFFAPNDAYDCYCVPNGYVPQQINLNIGPANAFQAPQLAAAEAWMDTARSRSGLANISIAPFATPSGEDDAANPINGEHPFTTTDSFWGALATACVYGHGIAIDMPAENFLGLGNGWPQFLESQIRWGNSVGIRTSVVLSPTDNNFQSEVEEVAAKLVSDNAVPSQWCVENYTLDTNTTTIASPDASDNAPNSLNAAALWLIQNAPVTTTNFGIIFPAGSSLGTSVNRFTPAPDLGEEALTLAGTSTVSAGLSNTNNVDTTTYLNGLIVTPVQETSTVTNTVGDNLTIISQGNDIINAGAGWDTIFASGSSSSIAGGTGHLIFVAGTGNYSVNGGTGSATLYGGSGDAILQGGTAGNNVVVAGSGNATLISANGDLMFGGSGVTKFIGSTAGSDVMVGGSGQNTFVLSGGGLAFGGNTKDDFTTGNGSAVLIEGAGEDRVTFGTGATTAFAGTGSDSFTLTAGMGGDNGIVGLKVTDVLVLKGFSPDAAENTLAMANIGTFGTKLSLPDGTSLTLWGVSNINPGQISVV